jgi:hypothetical protein
MEKDPEISNGTSNTQFRKLDSRIGRWLSIDPKASMQPDQSPYNFSNNTPIFGSDPNGDICIPCIYLAKVAVNSGAQAAIHVSLDLYNKGWGDFHIEESLSKIDMADAFIWSVATAPGASTVAKIAIVSATDLTAEKGISSIGIADIEGATGIDIPIINNKDYSAAAVDGAFNLGGNALGKYFGGKVSSAVSKPTQDASAAFDAMKGQLSKLGFLDKQGSLIDYKNIDPIVRNANRALYNEAQRLLVKVSTHTGYNEATTKIINSTVTSFGVGTANAAGKKVSKGLIESAQKKSSSSSAPAYPEGYNKYGESIVF